MSLAIIGDAFWFEEGNYATVNLAHRINRIRDGYTPADTECEEYAALCQASGQSWYSLPMGIPQTHTASKPPAGIPLCPICFPRLKYPGHK